MKWEKRFYIVCATHTHTHRDSHTLAAHFSLFFFSSLRFFARFSVFCGKPEPSLHCNYDCCMRRPAAPLRHARLPARHTVASLCGRLHAFFAHLMYFASFFPSSLPPSLSLFLSCSRRFFCSAVAAADAAADGAAVAALLFFSRKLLKC